MLVDMTTENKASLRIRLFESYYGHYYGWFVERNGQRIAMLTEPRYYEMFWLLFTVVPLTSDETLKTQLSNDEFWADRFLSYRNCKLDIETQNFIVRWNPELPKGTVILRGYPIDNPEPTIWEKILLFFRRIRPPKNEA